MNKDIDTTKWLINNKDDKDIHKILSTNYDISNLATKIAADKNASVNLSNLKKRNSKG